ncbi:hypothetical protein D3C79_1049690 [compost metagenome]
MSFVDVSPSTVIALNVKLVIVDKAACNTSDSMLASVVIKPSIVAIFGSIIPEPFATPAIITSLPSTVVL